MRGMPIGMGLPAEPEGWWQPRRWLGSADAAAVLGIAALASAVLLNGIAARTLHRVDCSMVCAVAILPAELALLVMTVSDHAGWWDGVAGRFGERGAGALLNAAVGLFIVLVLFPVNAALTLNQRGDRTAAAPQRLPVLDKRESVSRGSHSFYVSVEPMGRSPLGPRYHVALLDGPQEVRVSRRDYERAEPGHSQITLQMHGGLFGFPWYEEGARLDP